MTKIEDLAQVIADELASYSERVTEGVKKAVDTTAKEVNTEIKKHVTFNQPTGDYVRAFRLKKTKDSKYNRTKVWHVASPYYALTHLLENGHAKRNGGRTRAFPHVKYGAGIAEKRMQELTEEAIENAGH